MTEPGNRVVQVRRFGGPDALEVVDVPLPTAGRGEVRVRVLASGVEYTDVVIRRHLYPQTMRRRPPFVLGYDVVGEIDQLGDGVRGFQLGDRVADLTVLGSNAAYRHPPRQGPDPRAGGRRGRGSGCADPELDDRVPAPSPLGTGAARPARAGCLAASVPASTRST
jgi:alcohol dehydrogenase-like protein